VRCNTLPMADSDAEGRAGPGSRSLPRETWFQCATRLPPMTAPAGTSSADRLKAFEKAKEGRLLQFEHSCCLLKCDLKRGSDFPGSNSKMCILWRKYKLRKLGRIVISSPQKKFTPGGQFLRFKVIIIPIAHVLHYPPPPTRTALY